VKSSIRRRTRKKINVYLDFASILKRFRDEGYKNLCSGGANCGLLVAYILCGLPRARRWNSHRLPVIDFLKFYRFYIGRAWITEYGDPDNSQDRVFPEKYSLYCNIREGSSTRRSWCTQGFTMTGCIHSAHLSS